MKRKLRLQVDSDKGPSEQKKYAQIHKPTENELNQFFVNLSKTEGKPVLLSHTPGFSNLHVPINCDRLCENQPCSHLLVIRETLV